MRWRGALVAALLVFGVAGCSKSSSELARDCRGRDLEVTRIAGRAAAGHDFDEIHLRNKSSTTCALTGYPTSLTGTSETGSAQIEFGHVGYAPDPKPGNLASNATTGLVLIEWTTACRNGEGPGSEGPIYHDVQLFVRGGGVVSLNKLTLDARCGIRVSRLGVRGFR